MKKMLSFLFYLIIFTLFISSLLIINLGDWFSQRFGIKFEEIIYTLIMPMKGADTDFFQSAVSYVFPICFKAIVIFICIILFDFIFLNKVELILYFTIGKKLKANLNFVSFYRSVTFLAVISLFTYSIVYADKLLALKEYLQLRMSSSNVIEDYYIPPEIVTLMVEGKKKI